jgi:hypothetical protein
MAVEWCTLHTSLNREIRYLETIIHGSGGYVRKGEGRVICVITALQLYFLRQFVLVQVVLGFWLCTSIVPTNEIAPPPREKVV